MNKVKTIYIHTSASPQGRGDNAETIHRWHKEKGWSGIGYHDVILEDGTIQSGRPHYWKGAHVGSLNKDTIGVCLIGMGGDATAQQLDSLSGYINYMYAIHDKLEDVRGHYQCSEAKARCPGFDVPEWLESVSLGHLSYNDGFDFNP